MNGLLIAAPATPPVDTGPTGPQATRYLWHAWDGTDWDLGDPRSAVRLAPGVRGLGQPGVTWYTDEAPSIDGIVDTGFKLQARDVFWPLRIYHGDGGNAWLDLDAAFWRTLQPGKYGLWEVQRADGGDSRTLRVRVEDDGSPAYDTDPALIGWARYGVKLTAPDPYWRGTPVTSSWSQAQGIRFFNQPQGLAISDAQTFARAAVTNPGDVPAYPTWVIAGPTTSVDVGVGGAVDQVRFPIAAGKAVVLDTDPTIQSAFEATVAWTVDDEGVRTPVITRTGVDLTPLLGQVSFAPIPTSTQAAETPLTINVTASQPGAWVSATFTPRYLRAW